MNIIGKSFTPAEFALYVKGLNLLNRGWTGKFCVLHNTSVPSLAQRPDGFTYQQMLNLASYYEGLGWHAGPHLFVDDKAIWVFSPLNLLGVHSPSWNHESYGVEQLGEYETEEYGGSVRGSAVRANAVAAMAILCHAVGIDSHSMRLHKEDPLTTHKSCPGHFCADTKEDIMDRVHDYIVEHFPAETKAT